MLIKIKHSLYKISRMKRIKEEVDLEDWYQSPAFDSLQLFLSNLFTNVTGLKLSEIPAEPTEADQFIWTLLDQIEVAIEDVSLIEAAEGSNGNSRYGNKAFRILMERIESIAEKELSNNFLSKLLRGSFGDVTRIDYGTGHELFFLIFVACYLNSNNVILTQVDYARVGGWLIGTRYLGLVRQIQRKYLLEPAGSHGVWGLDDHQFVPFLLGSAQLIGKDEDVFEGLSLSPASIISPKTFSDKRLQQEYLYPTALNHIHQLKTRTNPSLQFHHHSPLLYDISGVRSWQKIHEGLRRMYGKEVLGKVPVVQHLIFDQVLFSWR